MCLPPEVDDDVLESVQDALFNDRQLTGAYHSMAAGEKKSVTLHPLGLIQHGAIAYLVATCGDYEDPRLYALHRFRSAEVSDEPSRRPEGFRLSRYIAQGAMEFGEGKTIRLKARVSEKLANYLRESPLSKDQKLVTRGEETTLTAPVHDSWKLQFWILSQGDEITVLQPVTLRRRIKSLLEDALAGYAAT